MYRTELNRLLVEIESDADKLAVLGRRVLVVTLIQLVLFLLGLALLPVVRSALAHTYSYEYQPTFFLTAIPVILVPAAFSAFALLVVARFEGVRKRGDAIFQEISDELQRESPGPVDVDGDWASTELRARLALRQFASSTDLPLIPGKYGVTAYSAINVFSVTTLMLSYTLSL